jgi:hypothetical protein
MGTTDQTPAQRVADARGELLGSVSRWSRSGGTGTTPTTWKHTSTPTLALASIDHALKWPRSVTDGDLKHVRRLLTEGRE